MPFFVNNSQKLVVLFHRQCSLIRSSKSSRILPLFYHNCIPRLINYQNIAFLGAKRHQFGNGRVVNVNMYVHSGLRGDACHLADRLKAEVL